LLKFRLPGPSQRISMNHWLSVTSRMCVGAVFLGFAVFTNATDRHDHRSRAGASPGPRAHATPARLQPTQAALPVAQPRFPPAVHGPGPYRRVHGSSVRVWVGPPPLYYAPSPYWAYPPYLYRPAPPVVLVPAAPPPIYVERGGSPAPVEMPRAGYWYWCESRAAYHPSAPDCPEGWIAVSPQPSSTQ
jgi:hypothetical protein